MSSQRWGLEMALYNQWQNQVLYQLCGELDDAQRGLDRGMFFHSIHNTLDHILMVDVRLREFTVSGQLPPAPFEPARLIYSNFDTLSEKRHEFDESLLALISEQPETWLDDIISFHSTQHGRTRTMPRQFWCMQMFNHATHHRSQVSCELHRLGISYGNTDMPYNPLSQY